MKSLIIYIGIVLAALTACTNDYKPQVGDLIFTGNKNSEMGSAIDSATGDLDEINFTHVGIVTEHDGKKVMIEATSEGGVKFTSIEDFLEKGAKIENQHIAVAKRITDKATATEAAERAKQFLGEPYDYYYLGNNSRQYCSELVWESFLDSTGNHIFAREPMNFKAPDGTMPQFWIDLFEGLETPIPQDSLGTNPNSMSKDPQLFEVYNWLEQ